jgi:hypothetical protein
MNTTGLVRYASSMVALAMCAACGGAFRQARVTWQSRRLDAHSKPEHFEYIINNYNSYASIFDYPKSDQQIGQIANVGGQGCTNALHGYGKKIIWIVAADNDITEYRIPKKVIKALSDSVGSPSSCAMDTSGDVAVGILHNHVGPGGDVVIFKNASGSGTVYTTPLAHEYFDGYDNQGNLRGRPYCRLFLRAGRAAERQQ